MAFGLSATTSEAIGLTWYEEPENETFQFGSGGPEVSKTAYLYPVGVHGCNDIIRMSCVEGGAENCPGLIGPSEMARWGVIMDFAQKKILHERDLEKYVTDGHSTPCSVFA